MIFGYDLLCDLLEMLNLINIGSAVATYRNLADPNMRGLMAERFRAFDLHMEGLGSNPDGYLFSFNFFPFIFYFMCNFFLHIFQYDPISFLQLIFLNSKIN
jgi:hypothetical protein